MGHLQASIICNSERLQHKTTLISLDKIKTLLISGMDKEGEQLELLHVASGNAKRYSHFGKRFGSLLKAKCVYIV